MSDAATPEVELPSQGHGLFGRLVMVTLALVAPVALLTGLFVRSHEIGRSSRQLADQAQALAAIAADAAELGVYTEDEEALAQALEVLARVDGFRYVEVRAKDGRLLLANWAGAEEALPPFEPLPQPLLHPSPPGMGPLASTAGARLMLATAVVERASGGSALDPFGADSRGREDLGYVRIALGLEALRLATERAVVLALGFGLLVVGIGLVLVLLVNRSILQPIVRLTEVVDRVAAGDLPRGAEGDLRQAEGPEDDEVSRLARAFERVVRRLALTLHGIADGVLVLDAGGRILLANPAAAKLLETDRGDLGGRLLSEVMDLRSASDPDLTASLLGELREGAVGAELLRRGRLGGPDGTPIEIRGYSVARDGGPGGAILVIRDVAAQARLEEERLRTSKLESVGVLAGGIAHDFNNLLTTIQGNVGLVSELAGETGELVEPLADVDQALVRAQELTQRLLTFSRGGLPIREPLRVEALIEESLSLALSGSSVRSEVELAADLPAVHADAGQLGQVLRNIVLNAIQAMSKGGTVRIRADRASVPQEGPKELEDGEYLRIQILDEGEGIPAEILGKVFDPYFTTKSTGSGLGLATAFSIIRNHEGHLAVESHFGEGSTFSIWLPVCGEEPAEEDAPAPAPRPRTGKVLVVDDEEGIRRLTERLLTRAGYRVETAAEGESGLRLYRAAHGSEEPFDVVLLDLTIPGGMGGKDTIQHLQELDPNVRAVVTSGYSNDPIMADHQAYGFRSMVAKPFRTATLVKALEDALESPRVG